MRRPVKLPILLLSLCRIAPISSWSLADRFMGRVPPTWPRRCRLAAHQQRQQQQQQQEQKQQQQKSIKPRVQEILDFLDKPMESMVGDKSTSSKTEASYLADVQDLVRTIVRAADGRKAEQIVALQVHGVSTLTSYMVILSGNSRPQNSAIAGAITKDVADQFDLRPGGNGVPEGSAESGWMLLDYGSVMVHIMTPKSRLFYNVEGQWRQRGSVEMDVSECILPNTVVVDDASTSTVKDNNEDDQFLPDENDPFWS